MAKIPTSTSYVSPLTGNIIETGAAVTHQVTQPIVASLNGTAAISVSAEAAGEAQPLVASLTGSATSGHSSTGTYYDNLLSNIEDRDVYSGRSTTDRYDSGHVHQTAERKFDVTYGGFEAKKKADEEALTSYQKLSKKLAEQRAEKERILAYQNAVNEKANLITQFNNSFDHETGTFSMDARAFNAQIVYYNQLINSLASNKNEETYVDHGCV